MKHNLKIILKLVLFKKKDKPMTELSNKSFDKLSYSRAKYSEELKGLIKGTIHEMCLPWTSFIDKLGVLSFPFSKYSMGSLDHYTGFDIKVILSKKPNSDDPITIEFCQCVPGKLISLYSRELLVNNFDSLVEALFKEARDFRERNNQVIKNYLSIFPCEDKVLEEYGFQYKQLEANLPIPIGPVLFSKHTNDPIDSAVVFGALAFTYFLNDGLPVMVYLGLKPRLQYSTNDHDVFTCKFGKPRGIPISPGSFVLSTPSHLEILSKLKTYSELPTNERTGKLVII